LSSFNLFKLFFIFRTCVMGKTVVPEAFNSNQNNMDQNKRFLFCVGGVFVCYFYYGIIQEKITRGSYGDENEKFTFVQCLVFSQCVLNALFAKVLILLTDPHGRDTTSEVKYALCSCSYLGAMVASNTALQHVNYPTQVLGKSCKPIPVMLLGVLLARKSYPLVKYLCVLCITAGVAVFIYKDSKAAASSSGFSLGIGELLLGFSLLLDGVTGAIQEKMRAESATKPYPMMLKMNLWSILVLGLAVFITGEIFQFVSFIHRHPSIISHLLSFAFASALGQNFIFMTISYFGPLVCSLVTTTRKFFTILASVIFFGNAMTNRQVGGTALVFAGLLGDAIFAKKKPSPVVKE